MVVRSVGGGIRGFGGIGSLGGVGDLGEIWAHLGVKNRLDGPNQFFSS